jgi:hypothetical protein
MGLINFVNFYIPFCEFYEIFNENGKDLFHVMVKSI